MRAILAGLMFALVAPVAAAQTADPWAGRYVGLSVRAQPASDGETKAIIDPGLDSRLTYVNAPPGRSYVGPDLESDISAAVFVGWRRAHAGWLVGLEAQIQEGGPAVRFDSGFGSPAFLDPPRACGAALVGCLEQTLDSVSANIDMSRAVSLRVTAGVPVSDRILLSAYAGPAVASGELELVQTSIYRTSYFDPACTRFCVNVPTTVTETRGRTDRDTVWGVVGGLVMEVRVAENLTARGDVGYRRFEALRGRVGGVNGGDSEVRAQSVGFNAGLGLSFRF